MKIVLSSEVSGYPLKTAVKDFLTQKGYDIIDVGWNEGEPPINYIEAAKRLALLIQDKTCHRGLIFCGSGAGVGIAANKHEDVFCVISESIYTAMKAPIIVNANVLALGAKVVATDHACLMSESFLTHSFGDELDETTTMRVHSMYQELKDLDKK